MLGEAFPHRLPAALQALGTVRLSSVRASFCVQSRPQVRLQVPGAERGSGDA